MRRVLYAIGIGVAVTGLAVLTVDMSPDGGVAKWLALKLLVPGGMVGLSVAHGNAHLMNPLLSALASVIFYSAVGYILLRLLGGRKNRRVEVSPTRKLRGG
jgi:hypothetical protein